MQKRRMHLMLRAVGLMADKAWWRQVVGKALYRLVKH